MDFSRPRRREKNVEAANIEEDNAAWRFSSLGLRGSMPTSCIIEDNAAYARM